MKQGAKSAEAVGISLACVLRQNPELASIALRFLSSRDEIYYKGYRSLLQEIRRRKIYSPKTTPTEISSGIIRAAKNLSLL